MSWLKNRTRESSDPMPDNVLPPALCAVSILCMQLQYARSFYFNEKVCGTKPRTPGYPTCSPGEYFRGSRSSGLISK